MRKVSTKSAGASVAGNPRVPFFGPGFEVTPGRALFCGAVIAQGTDPV